MMDTHTTEYHLTYRQRDYQQRAERERLVQSAQQNAHKKSKHLTWRVFCRIIWRRLRSWLALIIES